MIDLCFSCKEAPKKRVTYEKIGILKVRHPKTDKAVKKDRNPRHLQ